MSVIHRRPSHYGASATSDADMWAPTDGEINFLWSFIQGSIVTPETWNALLRSYGFCERHAWIHIGIEMSFRDRDRLRDRPFSTPSWSRRRYTRSTHRDPRRDANFEPTVPVSSAPWTCRMRPPVRVRRFGSLADVTPGTCEILQVDYSRCGLSAFAPIVRDKQGLQRPAGDTCSRRTKRMRLSISAYNETFWSTYPSV